MTREDRFLFKLEVPNLGRYESLEELMIRIVHLNDDTKEPISSDDVKDPAYGIKFLKNSLSSDQIKVVDLVIEKLKNGDQQF